MFYRRIWVKGAHYDQNITLFDFFILRLPMAVHIVQEQCRLQKQLRENRYSYMYFSYIDLIIYSQTQRQSPSDISAIYSSSATSVPA
jgi:hypothetical protein